jgi:hypothetical protein
MEFWKSAVERFNKRAEEEFLLKWLPEQNSEQHIIV